MSEPGSEFLYCGGLDVNCFVSVCAVVRVTSKSTTNVY
jgi:hypothetical protein